MLFNALVLLALFAALHSADAATYKVWVGYEMRKLGANAITFTPADLKVHKGDSVLFVHKSFEPHTVTFYPAGTAIPDFFLNGVQVNPIAAARTNYKKGEVVDASAISSSGLMSIDKKTAANRSWRVSFGAEGVYTYACAIHLAGHTGVVTVVADDVVVPTPKEIMVGTLAWEKTFRANAPGYYKDVLASVRPSVDNGDGTMTRYVKTGGFKNGMVFMGFFPKVLEANPGDTVVFYGSNFHTVTFLNGAKVPPLVVLQNGMPVFNPAIYTPSQIDQPITRNGIINSGLLVDPAATFSLKVGDIKGRIAYECVVHHISWMFGSIMVKKAANKDM